MKNNQRKTGFYSLTIKRQVLRRIMSGELSASQASREYGIGGSMTVYRWLDQKDIILGMTDGSTEDLKDKEKSTEDLIAELASIRMLLDHERVRSEAYLIMIKIAEEKFQIPIEKKSGAKQSNK